MEDLILWLGFIGAWLLFAGPIYQAALELLDQDIERERIKNVTDKIELPSKVSVFWWFIPPLKLYLEHRRSRDYRKKYIEALLPEDVESLIAFMNKATGWLMVAAGGLCIAIKETYELCEHIDASTLLFWVIVAGLGFVSILNTVLRISRTNKIVEYSNKN